MSETKQILYIDDIKMAIEYLKSIQKVADSGRFNITASGCSVNTITEDGIARIYIKTNVIHCDKDDFFEFNFQNINNLSNSLKAILEVEDSNNCAIEYTKQALIYKNSVKFKLKLVKPDIVDRFYTKPLKTTLEPVFTIHTDVKRISKLLSNIGIVGDADEVKIYYTASDDGETANFEIDDKLNTYSNNFTLPVGKLEGTITQLLCTNISACRIFTLLNSNDIKISFTKQMVFKVTSTYKPNDGDNSKIEMMACVKLLKK